MCKSGDYSSGPLAVLGQPDRGAKVHSKLRHPWGPEASGPGLNRKSSVLLIKLLVFVLKLVWSLHGGRIGRLRNMIQQKVFLIVNQTIAFLIKTAPEPPRRPARRPTRPTRHNFDGRFQSYVNLRAWCDPMRHFCDRVGKSKN